MSSKEYDDIARWLDDHSSDASAEVNEDSKNFDADQALLFEEQAIISEMLHQHYNPEKSAETFVEHFEVYRDKHDDADAFVAETMNRIERLEQSSIKVISKTPRLGKKPIQLFKARFASHNLSTRAWSGLAALFIIGLFVQVFFTDGPRAIAQVELADGKKIEVQRGMSSLSLGNGAELQEGDVLTTLDSEAKINFLGEETWIKLDPSSQLELVHNEDQVGESKVVLSRGKLESHIAKRDKDNSFVFRTPHMVTTILGTRIELKAGGRKDSLKVIEGKVAAMDLLSHERFILNEGDTRIADAGYAMPMIDPLDSVVFEEFSLDEALSLNQAKQKFLKRTRTYRDSLDKIAIKNDREEKRYGRVKGYIVPPRDGIYTFSFDSHEKAEFMLATESIQEYKGKTSLAHVNFDQKHQKGQVHLKKGQRYLFQVHYLFEKTDEHVLVKWQGPGFKEKVLSNDLVFSHFASVDQNEAIRSY